MSMCSYQGLVQDVTCRFTGEIKKAYSSVFDYFKFNHAWYYKITNEGYISLMDTNPDWLLYWANTLGYNHYDYYRHPKYFSDGFLWHNNPRNTVFNKVLNVGKEEYNFQFYLRLISKTPQAVECFGFTLDLCNEMQMSFILNGLHHLKLFTLKLKEDNQRLFFKLEDNKISLMDLLGPAFYEKPNLVLPHFSKSPFLKEGASSIGGLSEGEISVVKLLVQGYTASQIGEKLFRSKRTIEHRIERIKEKLGCFSKMELIQKARELEQFGCL